MMIKNVAQNRGFGHFLAREAFNEFGVERRLHECLAADARDVVGVDGMEDLAGQGGKAVAVAAEREQTELAAALNGAENVFVLMFLYPSADAMSAAERPSTPSRSIDSTSLIASASGTPG